MNDFPANPNGRNNSSSKGTALVTGASRALAPSMPTVSPSVATTSFLWRGEALLKALSTRLVSETGRSVTPLPEDMVDAALVGLDQGELVTIPGLLDGDEWTRFEAARRALSQRFGNSVPAPRYGIGLARSA